MPKIPERIGRYQVREWVGRGGMGNLYRGWDAVLEREVAIKVMLADFSEDESARDRFFREARAAAKLQHRNIVTVFEFAEEDRSPYIVMEFLRGCSLAARSRQEPPLSLPQKLRVVEELCAGLSFAHGQGVIHRDVKPANIWLQADGSTKLLDFGIARVLAASTITRGGHILGSTYYMAPEQVSGAQLDGRADIFSAGVVLYELLSGHRPWEGDSPTAVMMKIIADEASPLNRIVPDLPPALAVTVDRALQKDPRKRYGTAEELGTDLRLIREAIDAGRTPGRRLVAAGTKTGNGFRSVRSRIVSMAAPLTTAWSSLSGRGARPMALGRESVPRAFGRSVALPALVGVILLTALGLLWQAGSPAEGDAMSRELPAGPADPGLAGSEPDGRPPGDIALEPSPPPVRLLKIESDPEGAAIGLDGRETGLLTPAELELSPEGVQELRLSKPGYVPLSLELTDERVREGVVSAALERVRPARPAAVAAPIRSDEAVAEERQEEVRQAAERLVGEARELERAGHLVSAIQKYEEAQRLDSGLEGIDGLLGGLRTRAVAQGTDAYRRARQYDALGRTTEALALYERALQFLPPEDERRAAARERIELLRVAPR